MIRCSSLRAEVPDPCPRGPCDACRIDLAERAAIVEFDGGLLRSHAEDAARRRAIETMPGQKSLI